MFDNHAICIWLRIHWLAGCFTRMICLFPYAFYLYCILTTAINLQSFVHYLYLMSHTCFFLWNIRPLDLCSTRTANLESNFSNTVLMCSTFLLGCLSLLLLECSRWLILHSGFAWIQLSFLLVETSWMHFTIFPFNFMWYSNQLLSLL